MEEEVSQPQIEVVFPEEIAEVNLEFTTTFLRTAYQVVAVFHEDRGLTAPSLRVVFTNDVMESAVGERETLGVAAEHRIGAERLGGIVAGKALVSDDGHRATVLISAHLLAPDADRGILGLTIAHELGHILYAAVRIGAGHDPESVSLPWLAAERIPCIAAEEYRVDCFAKVVTHTLLKGVGADGEAVDLSFHLGYDDAALRVALDAVLPGLADEIHRYRVTGEGLQRVGFAFISVSDQILTLLAHAEAHRDGDVLAVEGLDHPAVAALQPVLAPFFEHVFASHMIPGVVDFGADRRDLMRIGQRWIDVWAGLGFYPRQRGESLEIWVSGPGDSPPPQAGPPNWIWDQAVPGTLPIRQG